MDDLRERLDAVEQAVTDGDGDLAALADGAATAERVETLETEVAELRDDVRELQAATRAIRGYVGQVRSINDTAEQRAETALAKVERLESDLGTTADGESDSEQRTAPAEPGDPPHQRSQESCHACGRPTDPNAAGDRRSSNHETDGVRNGSRETESGGFEARADEGRPRSHEGDRTAWGGDRPATDGDRSPDDGDRSPAVGTYDRPSLSGFDPDVNPDVPGDGAGSVETEARGDGTADTSGRRSNRSHADGPDASVVSLIRDLV